MYDKLIKRLHRYSENCVAYKLDADFADAVQQAADAIEELQAQNNELLFRCGQAEALIDYYQTGELPSNEPPKGERA